MPSSNFVGAETVAVYADLLVERDDFEPEIRFSVLPSTQSETTGTDFQREVWAALRKIRPGTTLSYGALAQKLGRPKAVRAFGLANGANPITQLHRGERYRPRPSQGGSILDADRGSLFDAD